MIGHEWQTQGLSAIHGTDDALVVAVLRDGWVVAMTEDHRGRTPREQWKELGRFHRAMLWVQIYIFRCVVVFAHAGTAALPIKNVTAFGPDAPDYATLLDPRVHPVEFFVGGKDD